MPPRRKGRESAEAAQVRGESKDGGLLRQIKSILRARTRVGGEGFEEFLIIIAVQQK